MYPWQRTQWHVFHQQSLSNSLPNGLLLLGPAGVGVDAFAQAAARFVLCDSPVQQACGHCQSCRWLDQNQHPDFFQLAPDSHTGVIKIDAIREVTARLSQVASRGGYQVVMIDRADRMNQASSNALLKTLEEPPGRVLFLLCCERKTALPATVISRCASLLFPRVTEAEALAWLEAQPLMTNSSIDAAQWLRLSGGAPLMIESLMAQEYAAYRKTVFSDLMSLCQAGTDLFAISTRWKEKPLLSLIPLVMSIVDDLLRLHQGYPTTALIHADCASQLQALVDLSSLTACFHYRDAVLKCFQHAQQGSVNEALLRDMLVLQWVSCLRNKEGVLRC